VKTDRLPLRLKISYGIGQAATGLHGYAIGVFLLFYYNQVLGLSAGLAGLAIGLATVVDAFTDPLVGSISDRWRSPLGRRHPFLYVSVLPVAISFYLLFDPLVTSQLGLFVWLFILSNVAHTALSLFCVPHLALGAEMSEDYDERSSLVAFRHFFTYVGGLLVFFLGFGLFFASTAEFQNGQLNSGAYGPFALLLSFLIAVAIFWSAWGTRAIVPFLPVSAEISRVTVWKLIARMFQDMRGVFQIGSFPWLFSGILNMYVIVGVNAVLDLYVLTFFWGFDSTAVFLVIITYPVGVMLGAPFATAFTRRWGKKTAIVFGSLTWAFWQMLPIILRLGDAFPENNEALLLPLVVGIKLIQGMCTAQGDVAGGAMLADLVDEQELETSMRQEGVINAVISFSAKATSGLGSIVAGFALELIDWPVGENIQTAADVPVATLEQLGIVYGPMIAAFAFISIWCFMQVSSTRERHAAILARLIARRASS